MIKSITLLNPIAVRIPTTAISININIPVGSNCIRILSKQKYFTACKMKILVK